MNIMIEKSQMIEKTQMNKGSQGNAPKKVRRAKRAHYPAGLDNFLSNPAGNFSSDDANFFGWKRFLCGCKRTAGNAEKVSGKCPKSPHKVLLY